MKIADLPKMRKAISKSDLNKRKIKNIINLLWSSWTNFSGSKEKNATNDDLT